MRIACFSLVVVLAGAAGRAGSAEPAKALQTLIEKAREREVLFDGVQVRYRAECGYPEGPPAPGDYTAGVETPAEDDESRNAQRFRFALYEARDWDSSMPGWWTRITWTRSGQRLAADHETYFPRAGRPFTRRCVFDGKVGKKLTGPEDAWGSVTPWPDIQGGSFAPTPDMLGITRPPWDRDATIREMLEARPKRQNVTGEGDTLVERDIPREVRFVGTQHLDGREVVVVEVAERQDKFYRNVAPLGFRMYFDPELDHACVRCVYGRVGDEGSSPSRQWTFSDFREVKEGLFVPYKAVSEHVGPRPRPLSVMTCTIESVDFPSTFDEAVFSLDFPAGIEVHDFVADVEYTVGEGGAIEDAAREVLAEPDGKAEAIPDASSQQRPPQIAEEGSSHQEEVRENRSRFVIILALCVLVACCAAVIVAVSRRRRGRNRRRASPPNGKENSE